MIGWFLAPILFAPKMQNANYSGGMTSAGGLRWKVSPADDEDGSASSISDVFADMLNVNEDMIVAAAESQAEGDMDGLIAYQRILHRDLMEMAEFIDSMFGVYSNADSSSSCRTTATMQKSEEVETPVVVDLTAESTDRQATAEQSDIVKEKPPSKKKEQRGALLTAIEAGEKVREIQRSKEQWIKSRHQVLEEEGVSAIMNDNATGMLEVATAKPGEKEAQQGSGGIALANQLRAHQHIAAFLQASKENAATAVAPPTAPMNLLLASQLALSAAAPGLVVPAPIPPSPMATATTGQQIKPSSVGNNPKIALPPAHSVFNMLFAFPGAPALMLNAPAVGGVVPMQWQPQLQTPLPVRSVVPARPPAKTPEFKRMCESCRKRHFSVRQCRLVLQHTDPEWQPAEQPPTVRRRRRKQPVGNTTKQVT